MRVVAVVQARLNSTRFPGKVLADLAGYPVLRHVIERAKRAKRVDEIVVAVPPRDAQAFSDAFTTHPKWPNIFCFDADKTIAEDDLIGRYFVTARDYEADLIVRLTADNPCVEPSEIDRAVEYYLGMQVAFVSNMHNHSDEAWGDKYAMWWHGNEVGSGYPDGIGCEVFSRSRLQLLHETITDRELREHPHLVFHRSGDVWSPSCPDAFARPDVRLDVNTPEDLARLNRLYTHIGGDPLKVHITQLIQAWDALHVAHDLA